VVAFPGEVIQIRDGSLFINGVEVDEPYLSQGADRDTTDFEPLEIQPGHVFVLGDNRRRSSDSRTWGPVPESHLVGKWIPDR
jgi:signal peptidase I